MCGSNDFPPPIECVDGINWKTNKLTFFGYVNDTFNFFIAEVQPAHIVVSITTNLQSVMWPYV